MRVCMKRGLPQCYCTTNGIIVDWHNAASDRGNKAAKTFCTFCAETVECENKCRRADRTKENHWT